MTRFTLTVLPDGRAILSTEEQLSSRDAAGLRDAWRAWEKEHERVLIASDCEVRVVRDIELDLGEAAA